MLGIRSGLINVSCAMQWGCVLRIVDVACTSSPFPYPHLELKTDGTSYFIRCGLPMPRWYRPELAGLTGLLTGSLAVSNDNDLVVWQTEAKAATHFSSAFYEVGGVVSSLLCTSRHVPRVERLGTKHQVSSFFSRYAWTNLGSCVKVLGLGT